MPQFAPRPGDFGRALVVFPAVGWLLGGLQAAAAFGLARAGLSAELNATLVVALGALVSGGLHWDGLADSFDALGGGRGDRARVLAVMRDSRIGAHGACALTLGRLLHVRALASWIELQNWSALLLV